MKDTALGINSKSNDRFKDKSLCSEALFTVMFPAHAEHLERKDPLNALFLYFKKLPGNVRDHMKRVFRSQQSLLEMFAADYKSDVYDALKVISQDHKKDFRLQQIDFTTQNPNEASWTNISDFPMVLIEILSFVLGHYSKKSLQVCTYNILFIRLIQLLYHVHSWNKRIAKIRPISFGLLQSIRKRLYVPVSFGISNNIRSFRRIRVEMTQS